MRVYTAMESGMAPTTPPTHFAYRQVDVFSRVPFSGNGLTVFLEAAGLPTGAMQRITQEMRQFESIFLRGTRGAAVTEARLFTMEEELDFAGHPVLGAACVLHERQPELGRDASWRIQLHAGVVPVTTTRHETWYDATMDQGKPIFGAVVPPELQQALVRHPSPKGRGLCLDSTAPRHSVAAVPLWLQRLTLQGVLTRRPFSPSLAEREAFLG
jgi:predicted PhzF superfamily epimerase YddE/YHI9